jgi:hypothetical protein
MEWTPPPPFPFPCYDHATLTDLLDQNQLTWKYYGRSQNNLWEAPTVINHICQPGNGTPGLICQSNEWNANVGAYLPGPPPNAAPILTDIENCNLPAVSWVIPDRTWSDHGGFNSDFKGPAWVAAIVNAVGGVPLANNPCPSGEVYWNDTVVLVVWDDWGGYYDHVLPWGCLANGVCNGYSNGTGSQYVYGFRVPLLVVSAYAKPGYISGPCGQPGQTKCPNTNPPYVHDFGSILNFIEWALGQNQQFLHFTGQLSGTGISPSYPYADVLAPDYNPNDPKSYSLSDFFDFTTKHAFQFISLPPGYTQYTASWFENFNGTPTDPDDDAIDSEN